MLHNREQVEALRVEYFMGPRTERLGQFLMNRMPLHLEDNEIFYEEDPMEAYAMYVERYTVASEQEVKDWIAAKDAEGAPKVDVQELMKKVSRITFHRVGTRITCYLETSFDFVADGYSDTFLERQSSSVGKKFAFDRAVGSLVEKHAYLVKSQLKDKPPF